MSKGWLGIIVSALVAISGVMILQETNAQDVQEGVFDIQATKEWTIMVYLDADNNLEYQGVNDFLEMAEIGSDDNINIIVQMDRIDWLDHYNKGISLGMTSQQAIDYADSTDDDRYGDWDTCKRFYVEEDDIPIASNSVSDIGEADMGDSDTLYNFISWSLNSYPANRYGLVLWDHGGQWSGVCWDETDDNNCLNMSELNQVFYNLTDLKDFHMDVLGFDACLMASAEVAYQMWGYTDYMIASEMVEPGQGWIYNWSLGALAADPGMATEKLCKIIVDDYVESYETIYSAYQNDVTLSVVNFTADFYSGIYAVYNFTYELYYNYSLYQNYINYAWGLRENYSENYCDMLDLFWTIYDETDYPVLNDLFIRMVNNLTEVYCYQNWSDGDNDGYPYWATGLSIYFPVYEYYDFDYTADSYFFFPQDTYWPDLLWSCYLQPTNTNPALVVNFPTQTKVSIFETQEIEFNVSATDSEGNYLRYYWFIDDDFVGEGNNLTVLPEFGDAGTYIIDCVVVDGAWNGIQPGITGYDIQTWTLEVLVDEEKPVIELPTSWRDRPKLGTYNLFAIKVTDNVDVYEVHIVTDFLHDGNITLNKRVDDTYGTFFFIPDEGFPEQSSDPGWHNITFTARDTAGNWAVYYEAPYYLNDLFDPIVILDSEDEIDQHEIYHFDGSRCSDNWRIVNYTWIFTYDGEEVVLHTVDPSFYFVTAGTYPVNLTIEDPDGNSAWGITNIIVRDVDNPIIDAGENIIINQHQFVTLNGEDSDDNMGIANWTWSFDYNGSTVKLYGMYQEFLFDIVGTYNITIIVKDEAGNSASDFLFVIVNDITPPVVDIEPISIIEQHDKLQFDGSSCSDNVEIANYTWSFDYNGSTIKLYGMDQEFIFDIVGFYNITVTVKDEAGNSASDFILVTVNDITRPVMDIEPILIIEQHDKLQFDGSSCSDNIGIVNYTWTFYYRDETVILYGIQPRFTFNDAGELTVTLTLKDVTGNTATGTQKVQIRDTTPPDANITYKQKEVTPLIYLFDGSRSFDNVGIIYYNWTIEWNQEVWERTGVTIEFEFTEPGSYIIVLEVKDLMGLVSTETVTITIGEPSEPVDNDDTDTDSDMDDDSDNNTNGKKTEDKSFPISMIIIIIIGLILLLAIIGVVGKVLYNKGKKPTSNDILPTNETNLDSSSSSISLPSQPITQIETPTPYPRELLEIKQCPHCDKELDFPTTPKFCPYCNNQLLK